VIDLESLVEQYRAGLEAELSILDRLAEVSARQRAASAAHDLRALGDAADDRDHLTAALVAIEDPLSQVRETLSEHRDEASAIPGYDEAVALHRKAATLAVHILETDQASLDALTAAEAARRDSLRAIENGETTLAAYRRVMVATPATGLVNRRG
jgi:hypothetical protein